MRGRTGRIHFVCPVVNRLFVIDLLPQAADERAWCPYLASSLLLRKHRIQYRRQPVLEFAVIVIRHDEVANTIHAASTQVRTIEEEVTEIRRGKTLDEVLLDATSGCNDARDVLVLHKVQDYFAEARGDEIRGIAEKDVTANLGANVRIGEMLRFILRDWFV